MNVTFDLLIEFNASLLNKFINFLKCIIDPKLLNYCVNAIYLKYNI